MLAQSITLTKLLKLTKFTKFTKFINHDLLTCRTHFSVRRVADVSQGEIGVDGGILGRISPFTTMRLVAQMRPYHAKVFSVRSSQIWPR